MRSVCLFICILMLNFGYIIQSEASIPPLPVGSFATLPPSFIEEKAQEIQEAFDQRTLLFLKGRNYKPWRANKPESEITQEFNELNDWRFHAWYVDPQAKTLTARSDFMIAQDLLEKGYFRQPNTIAFEYNRTDGSYNSSTIVINGYRFLALEAPTDKTLKNFYTLLQNYHVTHLVRLTVANENNVEKSYAYWKERSRIKLNSKTQEQMLNIPQTNNPAPYQIRYYATDKWRDNTVFSPKDLLNLIQQARKNYNPSENILACHCSNGVGRTGTFLAGFLLLAEVDKQIASKVAKNKVNISIEKIVMQLSLQRPYMISKPAQYIILYRLVDLYLQNLK